MSEYTFDQYHQETEFSRKVTGTDHRTLHNTVGYALLGLIGEMGEVVSSLDWNNTPTIIGDMEAVQLLAEFTSLAERIEAKKKEIRKAQIQFLPDLNPTSETKEELGGVYWYLNNLADLTGLSMADVAESNQQMLAKRFANNPGWMTNGGG
jgi:NTP pyrophosphatase (non-canonical NTP hydrolase)